jgi:putative tricarboxylic transport membrane protein
VAQGQAGNAHNLGTFHTGAIAGAVTGLIKADPRDFVPVAMMVEETSLVAVRADSPLKDGLDLVAALKADPRLRIAVAPAAGPEHAPGHGQALKPWPVWPSTS